MPPVDSNSTPEPTPTPSPAPEPKKEGFLDKIANLFKKKALSPPLAPPTHDSFTPEPRLENMPDEPVADPAAGVATTPENTDPQTGAPQAQQASAPDPDGTVTPPSIAVPSSVESQSGGEETPTVPVQPAPASQQPTPLQQPPQAAPLQPQAPQQPVGVPQPQSPATQAPGQPVPPAPGVQPPVPVPPAQQPPVPPQQ